MGDWKELPRGRLLADVSLWSADLANLERDLRAVSGSADSFHFDVADGRFAPTLLFFPDLMRALRRLTPTPFHAHLMTEAPSVLAESFLEAGADLVTVHIETGDAEVRSALRRVRAAGRRCGIALKVETPVESAVRFLDEADAVLLLGTAIGVKGQELAPEACDRIRRLKQLMAEAGRSEARVIADGAIRTHTVPLLREAGADVVVPGSLVFGSERPGDALRWLRSFA